MKTPSLRQKRVASEIQACLSSIFREEFMHHPVLGSRSLTVMEVVVSPDLRHVRVHVVPLGGGDAQAMLNVLETSNPVIRRLLGQKIGLRVVPHLIFRVTSALSVVAPQDSP